MSYYLIGEKLSYSYSKELHLLFGNDGYELKELSEDGFVSFIKSRNFEGLNVTIPYKKEIIKYLDVVSGEAKLVGAVNTVINKNGVLYGYNTDVTGLERLIKAVLGSSDLSGHNVLILGTGGTASTASFVSKKLNAKSVTFASRSKKGVDTVLYGDITPDNDYTFIINTTPCGTYPNTDDSAISLSTFPKVKGVCDAVYNPLRSRLVIDAQSHGIKALGGLYMLYIQALYSDSLFFGKEIVTDDYASFLSSKANFVLIGMPSCGKTTIGGAISRITGKDFFDVDIEITKKYNKSPAQIISENGIEYFRKLERRIISALSNKKGVIISTGGGSVLDEKNVQMLKMNGILFYIKRDISKLTPSSDRPLSQNKELLEKLYNDRKDVYSSSADVIIDGNGGVNDTANIILKEYNGYFI